MTESERDVLRQIHSEPQKWLYSMGVGDRQAPAVAEGCRILLASGFTPHQVKRALQESPVALDAMTARDYAAASLEAARVVSCPRQDAIDPETGAWIELPDDTLTVDSAGHAIGTVGGGLFPGVTLRPSAESELRTLRQTLRQQEETRAQAWALLVAGSCIFTAVVLFLMDLWDRSMTWRGWAAIVLVVVVLPAILKTMEGRHKRRNGNDVTD
jgi:hypothetical protein